MSRSQLIVLIAFGLLVNFAVESLDDENPDPHDDRFDKNLKKDIRVYLYTSKNQEKPTIISLDDDGNSLRNAAGFNPENPTKIIIHGYTSTQKAGTGGSKIKEALLEKITAVNVIQLDWSELCYWNYIKLRSKILNIVPRIKELLQLLKRIGVSLSKMHIFGHSFGANLGAVAAREVQEKKKKVDRITVIDPAGPGFWKWMDKIFSPRNMRVSRSDADLVDAVHTSGKLLGLHGQVGHIDYYPNDGEYPQPICGDDIGGVCSHCIGYDFVVKAIMNPTKYKATKCSSWKRYTQGKCANEEKVFMDFVNNLHATDGSYYLYMEGSTPNALDKPVVESRAARRIRQKRNVARSLTLLLTCKGRRGPVAVDGGVALAC